MKARDSMVGRSTRLGIDNGSWLFNNCAAAACRMVKSGLSIRGLRIKSYMFVL